MLPIARRSIIGFAALAPLVAAALVAQGPAPAAPDEHRYLAHVRYLASDELGGRGNGTPGLDSAADYIAAQFREAGLEPAGADGTYFQPFEIVTGLEVRDGNALALARGGRATDFALGRDYLALSVAGAGPHGEADPDLALPVVFAGYGITAPAQKYDDYAGVDVAGKAVLVLTHEPQEDDAKSPFEGRANTVHSGVMQKAMVARSHGARVMILVADPSHRSDDGAYEGWLKDPQADDYGITVLRADRARVAAALGGVLDLKAEARGIDGDLKPRSRVLDAVELRVAERFSKIRKPVKNVVGLLRGSDPAKAGEAVVVGAHYDHLGLGGRHSMVPSAAGQIHNGADDNASGTAAMLEIARIAAANRSAYPRTIVFVAFAGEELGLLGSAHYTDHPAVPLDATVAMVNLDMVGRPSGRVLVSGGEASPAIADELKKAGDGAGIEIQAFREGAGVGSSDDTSFAVRRIPTASFFSGFHGDYHRPSDDWDRLDVKGAVEVTRVALDLTRRLSARAERPAYEAPAPSPRAAGGSGSGGGYGAYFGSVPDFGQSEEGVKFAEVREGSPAAKAGFRRGDVLVQFGEDAVRNLYDFTFALRKWKPGDVVKVVVVRDGERMTADVELARRQ